MAVLVMCIRKFLVCFLLLAAGKSNMWKEITTRQLMSLRSMQGKRKSLRFGREFVHLWWFTLSKKIVYSLYCVEFFFFALLYSLFYLAMIFQLVVSKKKKKKGKKKRIHHTRKCEIGGGWGLGGWGASALLF